MKPNSVKNLSLALVALGSSTISLEAGSFKEISERLDLDGDFVAYMDFDGDGRMIGENLNTIYQQFAEANPNIPPFPLDFPGVFETLGFGSIRSIGMSSTEVDAGLHRNLSVTLLEGEPAGLFGFYDFAPIGFRAAEFAPADAQGVLSGRLNFMAITTTLQALASQVMGPMGEGMVMQGLTQPVPGTDVTAGEVVEALSGGMDLIMKQDFQDSQNPEFNIWLSLKDAGAMLSRLEPLFTQMGVEFAETAEGRTANLSHLVEGAPFGLFIEDPADSNDLILYTNADWVATFGEGDSSLASSPEFQELVGRLPDDAAFYAYSSGVDLQPLLAALEKNPETANFVPVIANAVESLFGGFLAPSASATYRKDDALITEGYAGFSYKGLLMALPAGIGAGVGAGIMFEKFERAAPEAMEEDYSEAEEE